MSGDEARNKGTERRFCIDHDSSNAIGGPEGVRQEVSLYRKAFPDLVFAIEDIIAEGDKVATRITASGTHERDLPGIPATGKRVTIGGMVLTRYQNGKAVEAWVKFDFLGLYRQLGVLPAREAPAGTSR